MLDILSYDFEGTAEIQCSKCEEIYSIDFSGFRSVSIEKAIENGMQDEGWEDSVCPACVEEDQNEHRDSSDPDESDNYDS